MSEVVNALQNIETAIILCTIAIFLFR